MRYIRLKRNVMRYGIKSHKAVVVIFALLTFFTLFHQWLHGTWNGMQAMRDFMGGYFLIFGFFKIIDLSGFVHAYKNYNIIAPYMPLYAYVFPFIQIALGILYVTNTFMLFANITNFLVMSLGFISISIKLIKKEIIPCACLGTLFRHPLSLVSLLENFLMVGMSFFMFMYHFV